MLESKRHYRVSPSSVLASVKQKFVRKLTELDTKLESKEHIGKHPMLVHATPFKHHTSKHGPTQHPFPDLVPRPARQYSANLGNAYRLRIC